MKLIIYTRPDGGLSVVNPSQMARLALSVTVANVKHEAATPQPVDRFLRLWPVAGAVAEWAETEEEFIARVAAKVVPADASNVQIVGQESIPADRSFRNAWKAAPGRVEVDMPKARDIHRDALRAKRAPLMAALDVEYMRADENGDAAKKAEIAAKKQTLRDVTKAPEIEAARTPDELKAVLPAALRA